MSALVRISAVAGNTVREAVRNRVLYTLLAFALVLIGSSIVLANLSYVEQGRIVQDIGFGAARRRIKGLPPRIDAISAPRVCLIG